jgi:hypothetical protein
VRLPQAEYFPGHPVIFTRQRTALYSVNIGNQLVSKVSMGGIAVALLDAQLMEQ